MHFIDSRIHDGRRLVLMQVRDYEYELFYNNPDCICETIQMIHAPYEEALEVFRNFGKQNS